MSQLKHKNFVKKYESPCMEVDYFETQDVILTSGEIGENPDEPEI